MPGAGTGVRTSGVRDRLERLSRERPEWRHWLTLYERTLRVGEEPTWRLLHVQAEPSRSASDPLLHGAAIFLDLRAAGRYVRRFVEDALSETPAEDLDGLALMRAAIDPNRERIGELAEAARLPAERLATLAELATGPLMRAAGERLAREIPEGWTQGYCPVCGAWPTFAEMRGLDRQRRLRCSRCGGDWRRDVLHCAYCGERDHARQKAFGVEGEEESRRVEACDACKGYTKAIATLTATPATKLALEDLASVEMDLVALERGYRRPDSPGHAPAIRLAALEEMPTREEAWT